MSETLRLNRTITFFVEECCACHMLFAMTEKLHDQVRNIKPGTAFYCPAGHGQHYTGESYKTRISELERQTIRLREERDTALAAKEKAAKATSLLKKRVKHGVCPCCNRTFKQLAAHMSNKHPEFAEKALSK